MKTKKFVLFAAAVLLGCCNLPADLTLAGNGETDYLIKLKDSPTKEELETGTEFARLLKMMTGADFNKAEGKTKCIFIGIKAPGDDKPLKPEERRRITEDGNLYLYGQGKHGNVNAVYDFLKDDLGCRFFTPSVSYVRMNQKTLTIPELNKSLIPSIPYPTVSNARSNALNARFARRAGYLDRTDDAVGSFDTHAGQQLIPSGEIPFGGKRGNIRGPFKYFKDKAYFKTNPEFFAKNAQGKRCLTLQLCYSNPELRDEIEKNIEYMLKCEKYSGGRCYVGLGQDDNGGKFCYCEDCEALEAKYKHPAGAYYDFLLDMGKRFEKKYPDLRLTFLAYRDNQTLRPSPVFTKLPFNLMPSYAPLGCDFSRPLTHPCNKKQFDCFNAWGKLVSEMSWWSYPTPYPRPIICHPLIANLHRLAENFRLAYRNHVKVAYCEYGSGVFFNLGFNDLRAYLISELCRNINANETIIKKQFCRAAYGPAREGMLKYIAELEKLEVTHAYFLRWNPDARELSYTTDANLLRWEKNFDAMYKLPKLSRLNKLNLARARYSLDMTVVARWPYMSLEVQKKFGNLETVIARAEKTLRDDSVDRFSSVGKKEVREKAIKSAIGYYGSGLKQFAAAARGGKALPEELAICKCIRIMPDKNKLRLDADPASPFGLCNKGIIPKVRNWLIFTSYKDHVWTSDRLPLPLTMARIEKAGAANDGKYHYYALGSVTVAPNSRVYFSAVSPQSGFYLGHLYNPKKPNQSYKLFVAVACRKDKNELRMGELVLIPTEQKTSGKPDTGNSVKNDFDVFS